MPFLGTDLAVRTSDGRNVVLLEPLTYVHNDGVVTTVPAGATSDGLSGGLLGPTGRYWRAAILHDYLYRCTWLPKDFCDQLMHEALLSLGVSKAEADAIHLGLKLGGSHAFNEDRRLLAEKEAKG